MSKRQAGKPQRGWSRTSERRGWGAGRKLESGGGGSAALAEQDGGAQAVLE